jgi:hypothetical protein
MCSVKIRQAAVADSLQRDVFGSSTKIMGGDYTQNHVKRERRFLRVEIDCGMRE